MSIGAGNYSGSGNPCIITRPKHYKFKPGTKPMLRFDILEEVEQRLPGFPIVLHGASSVIPEFVKMINEHGGNMPDAIGVPEDMLRKAASMAVCKINIDSDLRLAMTGTIRKYFDEYPKSLRNHVIFPYSKRILW